MLACTYLTVGHVLAESRAVGLDVVTGLEVGILRGRVECVGHGVVWSRAHVRRCGGAWIAGGGEGIRLWGKSRVE